MEFTAEEVREKLRELGYVNVPQKKLFEFMKDLEELIVHEESLETTAKTDYSDLEGADGLESPHWKHEEVLHPLQAASKRPCSAAFSHEKLSKTFKHIVPDKENSYYSAKSGFISPSSQNSGFLSHDISSCTNSLYEERERHPFSLQKHSSANISGIRRKVSRKTNGKLRIYDETLTDDGSSVSDITSLEDRLQRLPLEDEDGSSTISDRLSDNSYWSGPTLQQALPSFIRPSTAHPHTKRLRKCDPVSRYHQFKNEWNANKVPGESNHSALRWSVRGQMVNQEIHQKPRRQFSANNYVVPTEKKRQKLRWEVRSALAKI